LVLEQVVFKDKVLLRQDISKKWRMMKHERIAADDHKPDE
jgi:hypothetical protein